MHIDTAVIVEPRLHVYLEPVLNNMLSNLSFDTTIHIFHSRINKNYQLFLFVSNHTKKIALIPS